MPGLLDLIRLGKKKDVASDADGYTGQGPLQNTDDPADAPQYNPISTSQSQNPGYQPSLADQEHVNLPRSVFAGAGTPQSSVSDPYATSAAESANNPPPLPHPSGWRRAAGAVLSSVPFGGPFAGLAEYGSKGLAQKEAYDQWKSELPGRLEGAKTITDQQRVEEQGKERDLQERNLEFNKQQAQTTADVNSADTFGKAGGIIQPAMTPASSMSIPPQTLNNELPPSSSQAPAPLAKGRPFTPPQQFENQLPPAPQVATSNPMTIPGGSVQTQSAELPPPVGQYNRMPSTSTETKQGLARFMPTPTQQLENKKAIEDDIPLGDDITEALKLPKGMKVSDTVYPHMASAYIENIRQRNPTEVSLAMKQANGDPAVALRILRDQKLAERTPVSDVGTWSIEEDSSGNPVEHNSKTGEVRPVQGDIKRTGTKAKADAAQQKLTQPINAALNYATDYGSRTAHTGAGDEALMEQFFELAKPSSGFRMSQPQIDLLQKAQSWMGSLEAHGRHALSGTWFSDQQRKEIVDTMKDLASAKQKSYSTGAPATPTPAAGGSAASTISESALRRHAAQVGADPDATVAEAKKNGLTLVK